MAKRACLERKQTLPLKKQFASLLRTTFGLLIAFSIFAAILASLLIARELQTQEREQSILTFAQSIEPVLSRFDIGDIDHLMVKVVERNNLAHLRLVDPFGGFHEPKTSRAINRSPDRVIKLNEALETGIWELHIWWGWDSNLVSLFTKIALLLLLCSFVILAGVWFSLRLILSKKIFQPIQSLHTEVNRIDGHAEIRELPDLGSLELNELEESFRSSWLSIKDLAHKNEVALNREQLITSMVERAFGVANISICYALNASDFPMLIGSTAPDILPGIWEQRVMQVGELINSLKKIGISAQKIGVLSHDVMERSKETQLIFSLEVEESSEKVWNIFGVRLGTNGFAIISVDISEQRVLETRRSQSHKMEALGVIVSGVAHDVNNILATISGALELELVQKSNGSVKNMDRALRACRRGAVLTQQLLHISREKKQSLATIDQEKVLLDLQQLLPATLGPQFEFLIRVGTQLPVQADSDLLETTLINFVMNARDAMRDGGRICLESRVANNQEIANANLPPNGSFVVFDITDEGEGIADAIRNKIFDPFFTTKPTGKGTGLGLSLAYSFVTRAGGTITCRNRTDRRGAVFSLFFPVDRSALRTLEEVISPRLSDVANRHLTVLLVEDEVSLAATTSEYLSLKGIRFECAHSFEEASNCLGRYEDRFFNVLLVDMLMPDGTGLDVLRARAQLGGAFYGALTSGNARLDLLHKSERNLIHEFLQKPYSFHRLDELMTHAGEYLSLVEEGVNEHSS